MSEQMGCSLCDVPTYRPGPCDECQQNIDRLLSEYSDAVSRATSAASDLADMGIAFNVLTRIEHGENVRYNSMVKALRWCRGEPE